MCHGKCGTSDCVIHKKPSAKSNITKSIEDGGTHIPASWGDCISVRQASPMLDRLHPRESPDTHFYRRLSGPQHQPGHKGVKKNLHPSDTWDRIWAIQSIVKRLAAWATWPIRIYTYLTSNKFTLLKLSPIHCCTLLTYSYDIINNFCQVLQHWLT